MGVLYTYTLIYQLVIRGNCIVIKQLNPIQNISGLYNVIFNVTFCEEQPTKNEIKKI